MTGWMWLAAGLAAGLWLRGWWDRGGVALDTILRQPAETGSSEDDEELPSVLRPARHEEAS